VSEERSHFAQRIDERSFTLSRRGYDKREVRTYLEDLEQAFRELEGHARRNAQRVSDLERDLGKARATEKVSVDNAMMAVFDAKDRILERARRRADEIEEQAQAEASRIKAAAIAGEGGAPAGELEAARAQADEIVAAARREADRMMQDAGGRDTTDLEAELAATATQLRRAHADTSAAQEQLDAARKRIVELENRDEESSHLEQRFAELETHLSAARSDVKRLEGELAARDEQVTKLEEAVAAAERAGVRSSVSRASWWLRSKLEDAAAAAERGWTRASQRSLHGCRRSDGQQSSSEAAGQVGLCSRGAGRGRVSGSAAGDRGATAERRRTYRNRTNSFAELTKATSTTAESADRVAELESDLAATRRRARRMPGRRSPICGLSLRPILVQKISDA
jgi:DivIVA domain-containing protein